MEDQKLEPLGFVSGAFNGDQLNWSTVEKDPYAILQVFWKLDYLLMCDYGYVFTEHPNLLFVYFPTAINTQLEQHFVSKVQIWGLFIARF